MEVNIFKLDGSVKGKIKLPKVFSTSYKPRLILRAVLSSQSKRFQPKGTMPGAGRLYTAEYIGIRGHRNGLIGHKIARKPRLKNRRSLIQGNVAGIPGTVGGPRAHPPKSDKNLVEKINKKEKLVARNSAIAALKNLDLIKLRGHKVNDKLTYPIVVVSDVEKLNKTKDVIEFLTKMGLYNDIVRAKNAKTIRAGKGKLRGRKYKRAKSILFLVKDEKSNLYKAARNIEGVDIVALRNLSVENLSPSGQGVRLTILSDSVIKALE